MANNIPTRPSPDLTAVPVRTDEIAGVHYQVIKTAWGPEDTATDTDDVNGQRFPVGGAQVGATDEAAPGTDIAASGLNGRLQRIAQRITSLIALLPASLGQKTMANSLAVVVASDQSSIKDISAETTITAKVTVGTTVSPLNDLASHRNWGLIVPATFNGSVITFQMAATNGGTEYPVYDMTNVQVSMTVAVSRYYDLPGELMGIRWLRIMCATVQSGEDTDFILIGRS